MLNKTRSIVLHHIRYGESSLIVTMYTEQFGRISCMVSGVKSKKSRFPAILFQPLNLLEMDLYYRQNRTLHRIKEATCAYPYSSIPLSIHKSTMALFLAEVLYLTLHEEESHPALFNYLFHALQLFDIRERDTNFHLWFMLHLTRYLGIFPQDQLFSTHGMGSPDLQPFGVLNPDLSKGIKQLITSPQGPPEGLVIANADRALLLESIIRYFSLHIDGFSRIKSYGVLKEVFG